MNNHVLCNYAIRRRHPHKTLPPDSTNKANSLFRKAVSWETHNISCVDPQGAQKLFVAVGATPLVSQAMCIVDVLQLCPHVHQLPAQPSRKQVIIQEKHLSSLECLFWVLMQVISYTFQLNLWPGTTPRGTKTAECSQNNYSSDWKGMSMADRTKPA